MTLGCGSKPLSRGVKPGALVHVANGLPVGLVPRIRSLRHHRHKQYHAATIQDYSG